MFEPHRASLIVLVACGGCFGGSSGAPVGKLGADASTFDAGSPADGGTEEATLDAGSGDGGVGDAGPDVTSASDGGCPGDGGPGSFTCTGSLAVARIAPGGAVMAGGKVLVAGGWNAADKTLATAEVYDPASGTFAPTGAMAGEHLWAGWTAPWPVLASGKVLVAGGLAASGALLSSAELYDPSAGTFGATGSLDPAVIAFDPVTLADGSVLFLGGYSTVVVSPPTPGWEYTAGTNQVQRYDPTAGTFAAAGTLSQPRLFGCNVRLASGQVLAFGGWEGSGPSFESNVEQYDAAGATWSTVGTLPTGVTCSVDAFELPGGKVLLDTAYLVDPVALTATPVPNAPTASNLIMVQLANGDVLALGGSSGTVSAQATAQVYGAATGTWGSVGSLHQARTAERAFLLPSGDVLVVGGAGPDGAALAAAELYHP